MFKQIFAAAALVMSLAFFNTTSAQCGPNEVEFINETACVKQVRVDYGLPCTVMGSTATYTLPCCGGSVCVPIPAGMEPIQYTIADPMSGNSGTVVRPDCGAPQHAFYMDCNNMCNLVQWEDFFRILNLPD